MSEREQFEAWAKKAGWPHHFTSCSTKDPNGYSQESWEAWQARAQPQQAEAVPQFVWGYAVRNPKEPGVPHKLAYYKTQADAQACQFYCAEIIPLVAAAPQQAGVVPSSDLNPDEGDPVTLWAEIWRLREAVKGPDGYATWQDAATAERIRRVRAESKQAEEAKAVPTHDDTDLIKQMLEALRSCSGVSHWPALIPTINAARKRLETPQQAEAVPPTHVLVPVAVLEAAAESLGSFVSDNGWTDLDMQAMDNIDAILAQQKGGV